MISPLVASSKVLDPVQENIASSGNGLEYTLNVREAGITKRNQSMESLSDVHPNAAGLDIGAHEIWACVPADRDVEWVRVFGTFTPDLQRLVDWVVACGVDTVAMESTGVYWIPVFELLEARGLKVYLVNAL